MKRIKVIGRNNQILNIGLFTEEEYLAHIFMRIMGALFDYPPDKLINFIPCLDIEDFEKIDRLGNELATKIYYELLYAGGNSESFFQQIDELRPLDDLILFCDDIDLIEILMKDYMYFVKL